MLLFSSLALAYTGYLRTPDIHGDTVVFVAEGDLWTVPVQGGTARRLTSAPGDEAMPRFSPDGKTITFSGNYDGNVDVYTIPVTGGEPRRLTWHPGDDGAVGFTPDGKNVIFRARYLDPNEAHHLYQVPVDGGDVTELPLGWATWIDQDPASGKWAFTRTTRETATWKRYRGGTATDIWVGDPKAADFKQITSFDGADAFPMWAGGRVWFLSDQGGTGNLWSMKPDGSDRKAGTTHTDWDARFPAMGPNGRIVYMLAGDLHVFDTSTSVDAAIPIDLPGERTVARERFAWGADNLQSLDLAPDGTRVLLTVRGDVWALPVKPGPAVPVTATSGARESWAGFTGDGKRVLYVTDASGEEAIVSADAWGRGDVKTVMPAGATGWHFPPASSPDGSQVAWSDQTQTLWAAPAAGGPAVKVDHSDQAEITDYTWSPDGRWLAYTKTERTDYFGVWIWDRTTQKSTRISSPYVRESSPAWDPDGRYLWIDSQRDPNPVIGGKDLTYVSFDEDRVAAVLLRKDVPDPTAPLAGLPPADAPADKKVKKDKKKKDDAEDSTPAPITIDFDGIQDRVVLLQIPAGNLGGLGATSGRVLYARWPWRGMTRGADAAGDLYAWDLEKKKEELVLAGVRTWSLAPKEGKVAVLRPDGEIYVVDAGAPVDESALADVRLRTEEISFSVSPAEEWKQIYTEAWRLQRDFFWEPKTSGLDWAKERDRYATLLPRLGTRDDLRDLIGELIGELGTSHTYVWGGDQVEGARWVGGGLLGADVAREGEAFKVTHLHHGDPADNLQNPLMAPSAAVKEGEYIVAVNHQPFAKDRPFEAAFAGLADKPIVLSVNQKPTTAGARDVVVTPVSNDNPLRYADWVRRNREYVAEKTHGEVGYVHLPDMGAAGLVAFDTWFYPQLDKPGLIVDVRWNGGGFVSQMIVERLRRTVLQYFFSRNGGRWTWPDRTLNGSFVVITNEFAGSDGDIFPTAVQNAGLAPVIGARSWGGVVGIRGDKALVDGGVVTEPEYASWYPKKGWAVENHGVDPDIAVQNLPQELAKGQDTQLDRAIAEVQLLRTAKPPVPSTPEAPRTKTREDYRQKEK